MPDETKTEITPIVVTEQDPKKPTEAGPPADKVPLVVTPTPTPASANSTVAPSLPATIDLEEDDDDDDDSIIEKLNSKIDRLTKKLASVVERKQTKKRRVKSTPKPSRFRCLIGR
jgi:vacuolar-type H+-ATPase subunit I/STV1